MDWLSSNWFVAIVTSVLTGALAILGAWIQLTRMGVNASNAGEITDRAIFRDHLMRRIKEVEARLDEVEKAEVACLEREMALKALVKTLEYQLAHK